MAAGLLLAAAALAARPREKTVIVSPEIRVSIGAGNQIILFARPLPGEGLDALVKRITDDPAAKKEILASNRGLGKHLRKAGYRLKVVHRDMPK